MVFPDANGSSSDLWYRKMYLEKRKLIMETSGDSSARKLFVFIPQGLKADWECSKTESGEEYFYRKEEKQQENWEWYTEWF
jgi:hypothetical protein